MREAMWVPEPTAAPLLGHRWLTGGEGKVAVTVDLWGEDVSQFAPSGSTLCP